MLRFFEARRVVTSTGDGFEFMGRIDWLRVMTSLQDGKKRG